MPSVPSRRAAGLGVMLDQPGRALGDVTFERFERRGDVIARIDRLADVVQQGRQLKFLVVGQRVAGQLEDLQAVVQRIALGMPLGILLDGFQRHQQHAVHAKAIEMRVGAERLALVVPVASEACASPIRASDWISSRISRLVGRSAYFTRRWPSRRAAVILAR